MNTSVTEALNAPIPPFDIKAGQSTTAARWLAWVKWLERWFVNIGETADVRMKSHLLMAEWSCEDGTPVTGSGKPRNRQARPPEQRVGTPVQVHQEEKGNEVAAAGGPKDISGRCSPLGVTNDEVMVKACLATRASRSKAPHALLEAVKMVVANVTVLRDTDHGEEAEMIADASPIWSRAPLSQADLRGKQYPRRSQRDRAMMKQARGEGSPVALIPRHPGVAEVKKMEEAASTVEPVATWRKRRWRTKRPQRKAGRGPGVEEHTRLPEERKRDAVNKTKTTAGLIAQPVECSF